MPEEITAVVKSMTTHHTTEKGMRSYHYGELFRERGGFGLFPLG